MTPYADLSDATLAQLALDNHPSGIVRALAERLEMRRRDIQELEQQLYQATKQTPKDRNETHQT